MKRFAALFLCICLFLAVQPLAATADNTPKTAFTNYYLLYYDSSVEVQNFFMQALAKNTIKFELDADLLSSNVVLDNGATLSNMPGHASLNLAFNLRDRNAALDFQTSVAQYDLQGQVYFTEQGLIMPCETIKALAANGASFPELGDLTQLPDYLVYPSEISSDDWGMIDRQIQAVNISQASQIEATRTLLQEILLTIPDKCYYYSGSDPVLDLTRISLDSPELLTSLKAHSATLAERSVKVANKPPDVSQQEWKVMQESMRANIIASIDNLTIEQMTRLAREMPFELKKCKITLNNNRSNSDLALQMSLPDNTRMSLVLQTVDTMLSGATNSRVWGDFTLHTSDFNLDISVNGNTSVEKTHGKFDLNITGSGTDKKNTISGNLGLDAKLDWSGSSPLSVPRLTSSNHKIVKRSNIDQPIRVYLDGREIYFSGKSPWISEGNTMVQLSSLAQALGCSVDWQPPDTIIISNGSNENLTLYLGSTSCFIGGREFQSNAVPSIIDGRTYIPLRVLVDYYNLTVDWDEAAKTINLHHA